MKNIIVLILAAVTISLPAQTAPSAPAAGMKQLKDHVAEAWKSLTPSGRLPASSELRLALSLPLRNPEELSAMLVDVYDPASANFHHYLTPEEFTARFGATAADYEAVVNYAVTNGLRVIEQHSNRLVLDVAGPVANIEQAFHVALRTYHHPQEARDFYAPDVEPTVSAQLPLLQVSGLNNYATRRPHFHRDTNGLSAKAIAHAGTGPSSTYIAKDLLNAYLPGMTNLNGAGQSVGLLQFDGYYTNDIKSYITTAGITTSVTLTNVAVDGGVKTPGTGNGEVALDIEMVLALAPGVSKIYVYEAPNPSPWVDLLSKMANDNKAKQLSCSWGDNTPSTPDTASEQIFLQMAAQGQSFFNASGDSDAFTNGIPFPSESTNITQVGATTLTTTNGASYISEQVWNWGITRSATSYDGVGSSGGVSLNFGLPYYQQGMTANLTTAGGSLTRRNVPDVSFIGDNVYSISDNGVSSGATAGTSCAAPLWAGFMALVNQQNTANGQSSAGFINPAVYAIGKGANYNACFHDTVISSNTWSASKTKFLAVTGFDLCTGWGTPNGTNLINALAPPAAGPAQIVSSPVSQTNSLGATVAFQVTAIGALPLAYQWYFTNPISGATNTSLVISNVALSNAGNYFVVVTNSFGSATSAVAQLTVTLTPAVLDFAPTFGATNDSVSITGLLFSNVTAVAFNGVLASYAVNALTNITATVPAGAATGPISVTTVNGTGTSTNNFTVLAGTGAPVISSFTPTTGVTNSFVVLTGTNFVSVSGVGFNGLKANFTADSISQITAQVPVGATDGFITVTNSYGVGTSATIFVIATNPVSPINISQIFGGGGLTGAPYQNDYIELYNRSGGAVDLSTWSVQYAASAGTTWSKINLSGSIQAGHYYLVQCAGGTTGSVLPTPDASGTAISMSSSKGKVALMNTQTAITSGTSSPIGLTGLQDFVGYGSANAYEGTGPAPTISATTADLRLGNGAQDTGDNSVDFTAGSPNPRNSSYAPATADLAISKTHSGNFTQGDTNDTYTITVTNLGTLASSGTVTVVDTLPAGLTATAISGTGWTITLGTLTCTRADTLSAAASYPPITVTVSVATNAAAGVTNTATVSGGGDANAANNTATDPTTIIAVNTGTNQPPSVTTSAASGVTTNTATLNGSLNPNGQSTTAQFEYGLTTSYGSIVPLAGTFTGSNSIAVSTNLTGLTPATTYHFRLDATNANGLTLGNDQSFTTVAASSGGTGYSGILAAWEVNGLSGYGASPLAPASNAPNVTVIGLTRGTGVGLNTPGSAAGNAWGGSGFVFANEAAAITGNSFATFSVSNSTTGTISFTNIAAYNIRHSGTGSTNGIWQYQVGNGAFTDIGSAIIWGSVTSSGGNAQPAIDLSVISALQNVGAGTNVTFRIVLWGGTGSSAGTWYINNLASGYDLAVSGTLTPLVTGTAPAITTQPADTNIFAGKNAGFTVAATGTAPLTYRWRKDSVALTDDAVFSGATNAALLLVSAATNHTGGYSVVVSNFVGSITSRVATLTVAGLPQLFLSSSNNTFTVAANGGAVSNTFIVQVATNLTPPINWVSVQTNMVDATGQIRITTTNTIPVGFYRLLIP